MKVDSQKEEYVEIDLLHLAKALWHRAWVIILSMVLCGSAAFFCTCFLVTPLYKSSALMYVNNSSRAVDSTSVSQADLSASQTLVETYIVILKTRLTLNEVIEQAGLEYTYEELRDMISASSVNSTEIFEITVTSPDPAEAECIANTIVQVLPEKISEIVEGSSVRTVDFAVRPIRRSSPSITRNAAVGCMIGMILSCGAIALLELLDERVRDEEYLIQTYHLPVLAAVPDLMKSGEPFKYSCGSCRETAGGEEN